MTTTVSGSQITFNDNSTQNTAASGFGFKNRIINGAMQIDQRNAGASVSLSSNPTYTLDRWVATYSQNSKFTVQRNAGSVTLPAGFTNYLGCTSSSAYTVGAAEVFTVQQRIEGFNVADLAWGTANAQTVTLSFKVYSSLTGTFGGAIQNNGTSRSYPFTYSIPVANTWTTISITISGDTTGTWATDSNSGIILVFSLGSGSTYSGTAGSWSGNAYYSATGATSVVGTNGATLYITGVQLEKGSTATSFDYRPYGTELALAQRYYVKLDGANNGLWWQSYSAALQNFSFSFSNPVPMRASPTAAVFGTWTVTNCSQPLAGGSSTTNTSIYAAATAAATTQFYSTSTSGMTLTAEL